MNVKRKRFAALLLTACMAASALVGCGNDAQTDTQGDAATATTAVTTGGQLNVAAEMFSATLEPATNWDSWFVMRWGAGETLVRYDEKGNFEPWLAEDWGVAEDGLTWTFKIREGVKFSNGEDMLASDVVATIERLFALEDPANGGNGNPQGHFTYSSIAADDEAMTVTIVTEEPTPDMPGCMAYPWTMIIDVDASAERDVPTEGPICTGPYAFESFVQDNNVQMVRNEYYWNGEVPYERVNIMATPEASTRTMGLQDGSVDVALNISATDREVLAQSGEYTVNEIAGSRDGYAHINFAGVLGNDALRQGVMTAIDGQTVADVTTNGAYTYGYAVVPSSLDYGYDELTYEFTYDPEKAKQILDDADIVDSDGDGYRELDGKMIDLNFQTVSNRQMDLIAQAQAAQLEAVGIKCTVTVTENQSEVLNNSLFDLCSSNEVVTQTGDPSRFLKHWYSQSSDNYANYSNSEYDALYEKLQAEFDAEKRREYMIEMQQILLDDAAILMYGYFNYNICTTSDITGVEVSQNDFYWVTSTIRPVA